MYSAGSMKFLSFVFSLVLFMFCLSHYLSVLFDQSDQSHCMQEFHNKEIFKGFAI